MYQDSFPMDMAFFKSTPTSCSPAKLSWLGDLEEIRANFSCLENTFFDNFVISNGIIN